MSASLACARARAATDWLIGFDPGDGHGPVGQQAEDPTSMFTLPVVLSAYEAGADQAEAEFAIERSTGQAQLDDATALMREAAELFRAYERHHRDIASRTGARTGREEKAERNALMAARLEAWLDGKGLYPITADGAYVAHADFRRPPAEPNVRPVTGALGDPEVVEGLMAASGMIDATVPLSLATATAFRLQTPDPRFDPDKPVLVNGFLYTPATEA